MVLTFVGLIQLIIGAIIAIAGRLRHAVLLLLVSGLFGGSASIILTSFGNATISPAYFALIFVYLRILVPSGGFVGSIPDAFRANRWLAFFTIYGIASSLIAPRLFAGSIDVWPMRMTQAESLFDTLPLQPGTHNYTAAIYLFGCFLIALACWIECRRRPGADMLISACIGIAWAHIALGLLAAITRGTPADAVFEIFRNSTYAQLDAEEQGFIRIRGVFAEASAYAAFGYTFFVANAELWYRSIRPRATGMAALALAAVLFFSTSSTAYVGLAAYALFFVLRIVAFPGLADARKIRSAFMAAASIVFLIAIVMAVIPGFAQAVVDLVVRMTVEKSTSDSGTQRLFWAMQGWDAFRVSYGLGIGPGSFRSSSLFMAILGTTGIIGMVCFLAYLSVVFQPWRLSTWRQTGDPTSTIGGAFASTAILGLLPEAVSSPHSHPGVIFAIFAGAALGLRPLHSGRYSEATFQTQDLLPAPTGPAGSKL